jgi:hypothetical protein
LYDLDYSNSLTTKEYLKIAGISFNGFFNNLIVDKNKFDSNGNLNSISDNSVKVSFNPTQTFERHNVGADFENVNVYFDSIVNLCNQKEIKLFMIVLPFTHDYNKLVNNSEFNIWLDDFRSNFKQVDLINCMMLFEGDKEYELFIDSDHLSPKGRDFFTKELKELISNKEENILK